MEDNGIIVCGYQSKSKERAVDLVRFMVKNANDRYMALEHERMLENTSFLRQKHKEISDSLDHLQNALAEYHRKNKIIDPEEQIRISLEALAGYEQQINNISIEESYFAKTSGDDSPAKIKAGYKVAAIGQELKKLRGNYTDSYKPSESSVFLNSDWAIQRYLDVERIKLNVKLVSGLLEVISSELALAESQSSRTQAVIQVVQDAYVPDWKLKPKRAVWALGGFIISFVFCLAFVLFAGIMDGKVGNGTPFQSQMRRFIESFKS
jgi:capsule polysaccharide export protein KpsE/RkpR